MGSIFKPDVAEPKDRSAKMKREARKKAIMYQGEGSTELAGKKTLGSK